jgi:hypothetical protein
LRQASESLSVRVNNGKQEIIFFFSHPHDQQTGFRPRGGGGGYFNLIRAFWLQFCFSLK